MLTNAHDDSTEWARLISIACGMRQLLEAIAFDHTVSPLYRRQANELLESWAQPAEPLVVGEEPRQPTIWMGQPAELLDPEPHAPKRYVPKKPSPATQAKLDKVIEFVRRCGPVRVNRIALACNLPVEQVGYLLKIGPFVKGHGRLAAWSLQNEAA